MRNVWKVIPGTWHAWITDGEVEIDIEPSMVNYFEVSQGDQFIGSWDHRPSREEVAEAVEVCTRQ